MSCFKLWTSEGSKGSKKLVDEAIDHWYKKSRIQQYTGGDAKFFEAAYREITGKDFRYDPEYPTAAKLRKFISKIDWMENKLKSNGPSLLGEWFKLPGNIMAYNPITNKYMKGLQITGDYYRGSLENHIGNLDHMVSLLNSSMGVTGLANKLGISQPNARKELQRREKEFLDRKAVNEADAKAYYDKNLSREALLKDAEMNVLQSFDELIRNPNLLYTQYKTSKDATKTNFQPKVKAEYGAEIVQAAHIWHSTLRDPLFKDLSKGLDAYLETLKAVNRRFSGLDDIYGHLADIKASLEKQNDYVPTQVLDIFPTVSRLIQDIHSGAASTNEGRIELNRYADTMFREIKDNLTRSGHTFELDPNKPQYQSKDVIGVIDKYVKNTVRFNYVSRASNLFAKATEQLVTIGNKNPELMGEHIDFLMRYMRDTHADAIGINVAKDSTLNLFARSVTAYQFMSKLGWNIRSAARNATQALQNFVYFGVKSYSEANNWIKKEHMEKILHKEMKRHGVFFTDIEEMAGKHMLLHKTKLVEKDGYQYVTEVEPGAFERGLKMLEDSKLSKSAGAPMQWIENKFNRSSTFKIAFTKHYRELAGNDALVRKAVEKNGSKFDGKTVEQKIENEIIKKSSRYAAESVRHLHYDYSAYAKPKALRTPGGAILGQFSTYGINFFEYQRKIYSEAGSNLFHGDWNTPEVGRAVRLTLLYNMVDGMLGPLFNTDIGNLIQNDTVDRLEAMYWYFAAEPDEDLEKYAGVLKDETLAQIAAMNSLRAKGKEFKKPRYIKQEDWNSRTANILKDEVFKLEAELNKEMDKFKTRVDNSFHGLPGGPVSMIFGPAVSDVLKIGQLVGLMRLDSVEQQELHAMYNEAGETYVPQPKEDKGVNPYYELARLINPQFSRTFGSTIPRMLQGGMNIPTALGQEFGLYGGRYMPFTTQHPRERKEKILAGIRWAAPEAVDKFFTPYDKKDKRISKRKKYTIGTKQYTERELSALLQSLDKLGAL
tara:strand:+ start:4505 stop:7495 length:2991 start_codon:yes stop_codon:yes gene_type:complete